MYDESGRSIENVARNKQMLSRHYGGETLKSIASSLGLSYSYACNLVQRDRGRIYDRSETGEDRSLIAADYKLMPDAVAQIIDFETNSRRLAANRRKINEERERIRQEKRDAEWDEYVEGLEDSIFEAFKNGSSISEIASDEAMSEESVLRFLENELASLIRSEN